MYRTNNRQPRRANDDREPGIPAQNGRHNDQVEWQPPVNIPSSVTEQFRESWLTAIIGSLLFAAGMCLLFWNEGRAAKVAHSLDEALGNVALIINPHKNPIEYEGRLVHLSGSLTVGEPLTEPEYGVVVASVKLKRRVQIYQWIEIEEERSYGGVVEDEKHYYYTTEWKDKLIDSDQFYIRTGHENPKKVPIRSQIQVADEVKIGALTLGIELKKKFTEFVDITSDERPERRDIKMHSGLYYHSADLWNPRWNENSNDGLIVNEKLILSSKSFWTKSDYPTHNLVRKLFDGSVGDIRILFSYAGKSGDTYSIVGKLVHGTIVPYVTSRGEEILLQRKHRMTVDQMFHLEHVHNYWRTWTIRGLGWLVLFLAATCLANILRTVILNSNFLCGIIAIDSLTMSVSMSISLLVIGFAWVWYRPIVALCLAMASILPFIYSTLVSGPRGAQERDNYRRL